MKCGDKSENLSPQYFRPWVGVSAKLISMPRGQFIDRSVSLSVVNVLDGSGETLVLLGIVVLEADLEIDGFHKLALLGFLGVLQHLGHAFVKRLFRDFASTVKREKEN